MPAGSLNCRRMLLGILVAVDFLDDVAAVSVLCGFMIRPCHDFEKAERVSVLETRPPLRTLLHFPLNRL
jgi:hypothetical protein